MNMKKINYRCDYNSINKKYISLAREKFAVSVLRVK